MATDDATTRAALSARKGRTTALVIGIAAAVVAVAAVLLVEDQRQRFALASLAIVAVAIWLPLAVVLERALAAAPARPPDPPSRPNQPGRGNQAARSKQQNRANQSGGATPARADRSSPAKPAAKPAIAPWAYFVTVAFGVAGAGAGLNMVGYGVSTAVGTAAQLAGVAVGCGLFLLVYLLVSRWWRARRRRPKAA